MSQRVRQFGQTHSMELIFFPLIILILVGLVANTFQSSAIQTAPVLPTPFCTGNIEPGECYPTNVNGCDANVTANCNFTSSTKFSFLNPNSPFTFLLEGNILGFISSTFNTGENNNIIKSAYSICIPRNSTGFYQNQTGDVIHSFECQSLSSQGGNSSVPAQFPNTGVPMNVTSNGGNRSIWDITGCTLVKANYPCQLFNTRTNPGSNYQAWFGNTTIGAGSVFNSQTSFYAFYIRNGTILSKTASCPIYLYNTPCGLIAPYLFSAKPTFQCPNTGSVYGININKTSYYCLIPTENQNSTSAQTLPNTFSGLSFVFGVLLFFLGIGFAITTALVGFSINEQGTKMIQVMGIAIVAWSFIFGEFGGWLTSLPFNLGIITFLTFTLMFFMGVYWRLFSFD